MLGAGKAEGCWRAGPAPWMCSASRSAPGPAASRSLGHGRNGVFPAGVFSSWDLCYGKTPQQAFPASWKMLPAGFLLPGVASGAGRCSVEGITASSSMSNRMEQCPQPERALLGCPAHGAPGWGSWGPPQRGAGWGPQPGPIQTSAPLCVPAPAVSRCILGSRIVLAGPVGTTFATHPQVPQHPTHPGSHGDAGKPLCSYERHVWQGDQRNRCH